MRTIMNKVPKSLLYTAVEFILIMKLYSIGNKQFKLLGINLKFKL